MANKATTKSTNLESLTLEGKEMSKDIESKDVQHKTKEELSYEQKKAMRRNAIDKTSRLYLDDKFKEKGFNYRICNVTPGNIETYLDKGYEVVTHPMSSGTGSISQPEVDGTPREFEVGGASGSRKAIWMRISDENLKMLREIEKENADNQTAMLYRGKDGGGNSFIPDGHQYGKITKEN
jgi:hypothetical protein